MRVRQWRFGFEFGRQRSRAQILPRGLDVNASLCGGDLRTLARLQEDLEREHGILIGITQMWNILDRMGLRFKKSRSTLPNRTVSGLKRKGNSGGKESVRSIRIA